VSNATVSDAIEAANITARVGIITVAFTFLTAAATAIIGIWTTAKSLRVSSRNNIIAAFANDAGFRNAVGDIVGASSYSTVVDGMNNAGVQVLLALKKDGPSLQEKMMNDAQPLKTGANSQAADKLREYFRELLSA
jgi:hypothetical protein